VSEELQESWSSFATLCLGFYPVGQGGDATRQDDWFAALSRTASGELNVCGLLPGSTRESAEQLVEHIGAEQPAIVFTSEHVQPDARTAFVDAGYEVTTTSEPLMRCAEQPRDSPHGFTVRAAESEDDLLLSLTLASQAHHVPLDLLTRSIGEAARRGAVTAWIAFDGEQAVSTVLLRRSGSSLGVMEMMTPLDHQRRGAGRAALSTALNRSWSDGVNEALLLSTPAGRHLYESVGFVAIDEVQTCFRGSDDDVLDAIGQTP